MAEKTTKKDQQEKTVGIQKLLTIQNLFDGKKDLNNDFGHFKYRNAEELFKRLKPMMLERKCSIVIDNEMCLMGERHVIKSTATFVDFESDFTQSSSAYAGVEWGKKGMDASQVVGSAESYAIKYSLMSLLLLSDGSLDPDDPRFYGEEKKNDAADKLVDMILNAQSREELDTLWKDNKQLQGNEKVISAFKSAAKNFPKK